MQEYDYTQTAMRLHFIEMDIQVRADFARTAMQMGYHCELYDDFSEIAAHPPRSGIIFVRDKPEYGGIALAIERLMGLGIWLPVIALDFNPNPSRVVQAVKDGALDYLALPLKPERTAASIERIAKEAAEASEIRRLTIEARNKLATLSSREGEVLEGLTGGASNKEIARMLSISPRTVEIHRANMMSKLGARSAADAVRIRLEGRVRQRTAGPAMQMQRVSVGL